MDDCQQELLVSGVVPRSWHFRRCVDGSRMCGVNDCGCFGQARVDLVGVKVRG